MVGGVGWGGGAVQVLGTDNGMYDVGLLSIIGLGEGVGRVRGARCLTAA